VLPHTLQGVAALTAIALVSHAGGQGLLAVALGRLPPVFSSLVIFLEAVVAAICGWIALGEALTLVQALGGALILLGIWTARPRPAAPVG
jgi:drug/metabolite transporter (DMT)-like permease